MKINHLAFAALAAVTAIGLSSCSWVVERLPFVGVEFESDVERIYHNAAIAEAGSEAAYSSVAFGVAGVAERASPVLLRFKAALEQAESALEDPDASLAAVVVVLDTEIGSVIVEAGRGAAMSEGLTGKGIISYAAAHAAKQSIKDIRARREAGGVTRTDALDAVRDALASVNRTLALASPENGP